MSLREVRVSGDDPLRFFLRSLYTTLIPDLPSQGQIRTDWMSWLLASSMTILSPILKLLRYWFNLRVQRTRLIYIVS